MKFIKIFFLIIFFLIINLNYANSENKVAFIDLDRVLQKSNAGKTILEEIKNINDLNVKELRNKETELRKIENEIKIKQNILSKEEFDSEVKKFNEKVINYKKIKDNMVKNIEKQKNDKLNNFFSKINPIIQTHMESNSIDILLDRKNVFVGKNKSDITDVIIKKINQTLNK